MEAITNDFNTALEQQPERPQFLKVLCILSFIGCGLMIILYFIGTMCLVLDQDTIDKVWPQMVKSYPALDNLDSAEFIHNVGMVCFYCLLANIVSLVGVIFMWRLEKTGFYIYAIAELSVNFFNVNVEGAERSYAGLVLGIFLDLAFIVMYFVNLKYMNRSVKQS